VNNLKVDEPRPAGLLVIDHIVGSRVAVRPRPAKLIASELMSASEFVASRFHHSLCERALYQTLPKVFSWQFVGANRFFTGCPGAKTIAIEHFETFHFPASPILGFGPETNRYAGHAKIQIRQVSQLFSVTVASFDHHTPPMKDLLGDRINF
jgi:hypothetical protein